MGRCALPQEIAQLVSGISGTLIQISEFFVSVCLMSGDEVGDEDSQLKAGNMRLQNNSDLKNLSPSFNTDVLTSKNEV